MVKPVDHVSRGAPADAGVLQELLDHLPGVWFEAWPGKARIYLVELGNQPALATVSLLHYRHRKPMLGAARLRICQGPHCSSADALVDDGCWGSKLPPQR